MSLAAMNAVFESDLPLAERMVMLVIADHADEKGECWPSIQRLTERSGMSDRGVQKVLAKLVERGVLTRVSGNGRTHSNRYRIALNPEPSSPLSKENPERGSVFSNKSDAVTPNDVHPLKAETPNDVPETPNDVHPNQEEPREESANALSGSAKLKTKKVGTRLSPDWVLPKPWGDWAIQRGMSVADIRTEAELFFNHWTANAGRNATKLDWAAAWRTWCINEMKWKGTGNGRRPADDIDEHGLTARDRAFMGIGAH